MKLFQVQPVLVIGFVAALLALLVAFGVKVSDTQTKTILAFIEAIFPLAAALLAKAFVVPVAKLEDARLDPNLKNKVDIDPAHINGR